MDNKLSTFETNLRKYWTLASSEHVSAGVSWYLEAHDFARSLAAAYSVDFDLACRVVAVLSPRLRWEQNMEDAETIISAWAAGVKDITRVRTWALKANVQKAFDILDGDVDRLRGPKVTCFYANIKDPTESNTVTIDKHAYTACIDDLYYPYDNGVPKKDMPIAQAAYQNVARECGLAACQFQAVVWLVVRDERA